VLEYSRAFLDQNDKALDELLKLLTPAGQNAALELANMELEVLRQEKAAEPGAPAGT